MRALTFLVVAGSVMACTSPVEEATLELGTGSWRFESLADGTELELIRGSQGGWHVWISVRTRGVDDRSTITTSVGPADESRPAVETTVIASLDPESGQGHRDFVGYAQVIDEPSCMVGEMLRIEASIEVDGQVARSERYIVPLGGTYPPPACE